MPTPDLNDVPTLCHLVGVQTEDSNKTVGVVWMTYAEHLDGPENTGKYAVELNDGSSWLIAGDVEVVAAKAEERARDSFAAIKQKAGS